MANPGGHFISCLAADLFVVSPVRLAHFCLANESKGRVVVLEHCTSFQCPVLLCVVLIQCVVLNAFGVKPRMIVLK